MNFLLIPDGLRRFARQHQLSYRENYMSGARKMFADVDSLASRFDRVGVFPLASYNLLRTEAEVEALLVGLCDSLSDYVHVMQRQVIVIGDERLLLAKHAAFSAPLSYCKVNPHLEGGLAVPVGALIMYLCYDGLRYVRQLLRFYDDPALEHQLPKWDFVYRTGCEHAVFRYSALVPGTDQARLACTDRLFQEVDVQQMIDPFRPWLV